MKKVDKGWLSVPTMARNIGEAVDDVEYNLSLHGQMGQHWRSHSPAYHVWKALKHLLWYTIGNKREPHLTHAATRLLFAIQLCYERPPARQPWAIYGADKCFLRDFCGDFVRATGDTVRYGEKDAKA